MKLRAKDILFCACGYPIYLKPKHGGRRQEQCGRCTSQAKVRARETA